MKLLRFTLVFFILFLPVINIEAVHPRTAATVSYLYHTDMTAAEDYKSLLISYGITVHLLNISEIGPTWFYECELIIIGSDTGSMGTWGTGFPTAFDIDLSGKPFLGLGSGGYAFFGELGLDIGHPHGGHESETRIHVADVAHQIFTSPIMISIPLDNILELYSSTSNVNIYAPSPGPDITLLGRDPDLPDHYPLLQEDLRYVLWGFTASPDDMTQTGKDLFINIVLWLTDWTAPTGYSVAFIYSTDLVAAESFRTLLETNSITVDLVLNSSAETWDYGGYGAIIIGSDTGFGSEWKPESAALAIASTGKPILGLGFGGSCFFGKIGSILRWDYGWIGYKNSIHVVEPGHQVFYFPNEIVIPPGMDIQLYTATEHVGIYRPYPEYYAEETPLGRETDDLEHYPLMQEYSELVLWGFTASPDDMTQTGKDLFINVVIWLQGQIIPEFSYGYLLLLALLTTLAVTTTKKRKQAEI
jgi:hypothetical protein